MNGSKQSVDAERAIMIFSETGATPESPIGRISLDLRSGQMLAAKILAAVKSFGYAHIKQLLSVEEFEAVSEQMGAIYLRTDLALKPDLGSIVYKSDGIGFHADNPTVYIIGWYCVRQDETDGSSRLIDTSDLIAFFAPDELDALGTITVRCPDHGRHDPDNGVEAYFYAPLVSRHAARCHVYYAPWHLPDIYDEIQTRALEKFFQYVEAKERAGAISIRLKEDESLFFDNRRMLHGRGAIGQESKRLIKRVWIRNDS